MPLTLEIGGKTHLFASLREATMAARDRQQLAVNADRSALDATIEFGQWLLAIRPRVPSGVWGRHLTKHGIHRKRAARAMRLAEWDAEGRPNRAEHRPDSTGPSWSKTPAKSRPMTVHQAEIAAGLRKEPLPMLDDDGDFEVGSAAPVLPDDDLDEPPASAAAKTSAVRPARAQSQLELSALYEERLEPHLAAAREALAGLGRTDLAERSRAVLDRAADELRRLWKGAA